MEKDRKRIWISIIIPVCNVKAYLRKCIQSITSQGDFGGRYEIILVDDGSSDGSGQICDAFGQRYSFIRVLHQENAGLGAARNAGIRAAAGAYLLFVDADDFIGRGSLARIFRELARGTADLYFLDSYKYFGKGRLQAMIDARLQRVNALGKSGCMKLFGALSKYPGSACDKLVRRSLVMRHGIWFEEGVLGEDLVWVLKCLVYAGSYRYIRADYYYYRQNRSGSITSRLDAVRFADQIHAVRQGAAVAAQPQGRRYRREIYAMMAYEAEVALLFLGMLQGMDQDGNTDRNKDGNRRQRKKAEDVLWLLAYGNGRRTWCIRQLVHGAGIEKTANLLARIYRIKSGMQNIVGQKEGRDESSNFSRRFWHKDQ